MKKRLDELSKGESGIIIQIGDVGDIKRRLLDMGLVNGTRIKVERIAPLGDPIQIKIMDYMLSLRKKEARKIEIKLN